MHTKAHQGTPRKIKGLIPADSLSRRRHFHSTKLLDRCFEEDGGADAVITRKALYAYFEKKGFIKLGGFYDANKTL